MTLAAELSALRQRIVDRLAQVLPDEKTAPATLHAAMRHGALPPGKCVRGCLVYASGRALGLEPAPLDRAACAMELVHAFSLVHDDLPCMDDDALRRGQPSCHAAYGETAALLAGNALLLVAVEELAGATEWPAAQRSACVAHLCREAGAAGMIGGQLMDMELPNAAAGSLETLNEVYRRKTGCLIHAAVMLPTELAAPEEAQRQALDAYGSNIGLAFQIRDDLEDVEQDRPDADDDAPPTYPSLIGMPASRERLAELGADALAALADFGPQADLLRGLARALTTPGGSAHFEAEA